MPIKYKVNILESLKKAGYTTTRLRNEKIFGERTIQKMRNGEVVSAESLGRICKLLHCQPGDILEYVEDPE